MIVSFAEIREFMLANIEECRVGGVVSVTHLVMNAMTEFCAGDDETDDYYLVAFDSVEEIEQKEKCKDERNM